MAEARESEVLEWQASTSSHVSSILDRLKAPKKFELTRKRKVHSNLPPKGKRQARGEGANEPMSINPSQHVKEFPSKCLTVSHNKLFCTACREELSLRKGVIVSHVASTKHKNGKERRKSKQCKERERYCWGFETKWWSMPSSWWDVTRGTTGVSS